MLRSISPLGLRNTGGERTKDMTGVRVGMLVVERQAPSASQSARWYCRCDCGGTKVVPGNQLRIALRRGHVSSCGCYNARRRAGREVA